MIKKFSAASNPYFITMSVVADKQDRVIGLEFECPGQESYPVEIINLRNAINAHFKALNKGITINHDTDLLLLKVELSKILNGFTHSVDFEVTRDDDPMCAHITRSQNIDDVIEKVTKRLELAGISLSEAEDTSVYPTELRSSETISGTPVLAGATLE